MPRCFLRSTLPWVEFWRNNLFLSEFYSSYSWISWKVLPSTRVMFEINSMLNQLIRFPRRSNYHSIKKNISKQLENYILIMYSSYLPWNINLKDLSCIVNRWWVSWNKWVNSGICKETVWDLFLDVNKRPSLSIWSIKDRRKGLV